jgi:hypothetical protein
VYALDAYTLNPFFFKSYHQYYSSVDTPQITQIATTSCSPFDSAFTQSSCPGVVTSVVGDRALITGFDAVNRILVTQVLIQVGESLDLTIGYQHAFFQSSWDTVN